MRSVEEPEGARQLRSKSAPPVQVISTTLGGLYLATGSIAVTLIAALVTIVAMAQVRGGTRL